MATTRPKINRPAWHGHYVTTMRGTYSHTTVEDLRTVLDDQNVTRPASQ